MQKKSRSSNKQIAAKKNSKLIGIIISFGVSLGILLLLEAGLRAADAFTPEPLTIETIVQGRLHHQLNPFIARRYFPPTETAVPTLYPETFTRQKPEKTFRIFCLGGSTTAGFPYDYQVPFPQQLRYLLSQQYPDRQFEVVNLGLSAINSFAVRDLIDEVLILEPDLILMYMGHNEFYGVYGSASTFSVGSSGSWINFYLRIQQLRIVRMLQSFIFSFSESRQEATDASLMEKLANDHLIQQDSETYKKTIENFNDNFEAIVQSCQNSDVPIIVSTLVSNLRDLPPFEARDDWDKANQLKKASENFSLELDHELDVDSATAMGQYLIGLNHLAKGDTDDATRQLSLARDLDGIRFRASSSVNNAIEAIATRYDLPLLRVDRFFANKTRLGVPGDDLFVDHLHPNPDGYYLMARAFQEAISQLKLIDQNPRRSRYSPIPNLVSELDWNIGRVKIEKMMHRWPYPTKNVDPAKTPAIGHSTARDVAHQYIFNHQDWVKAHYDMAGQWLRQNRPDKAINEYLAVAFSFPNDPDPLQKAASIKQQLGDWAATEFYCQEALKRSQNGLTRYFLAGAQWHQKKAKEAIANMQLAAASPDLNQTQRRKAEFDLAGFLLSVGKKQEAITLLQSILKNSPDFQPAAELLKQIP